MKYYSILLITIIIYPLTGFSQDYIFTQGTSLKISGTNIPIGEKEDPYDRIPSSYKEKVRKPVWNLSKNSAGISVDFQTDAPDILVKWEVINNADMPHMAETGIKGIDLYAKVNGLWQYVNTGKPSGYENKKKFILGQEGLLKELKIYLPLYDGVKNLEIGIPKDYIIKKGVKSEKAPIIFYGTSITQGGCASRTGMAHTNILSRMADRDCINLGFSGNGRMELEIGEIMVREKASLFIVECLPNMKPEQITERTSPLIKFLRENQPKTPIVLVKSFIYENSFFDKGVENVLNEKDIALQKEFKKLIDEGYENLYLLETEGALGYDHEGTVDGVHFTDLGFIRYAKFLHEKLSALGLL